MSSSNNSSTITAVQAEARCGTGDSGNGRPRRQNKYSAPKRLALPRLPTKENPNAYRFIQLHNGVKVLLISTLDLELDLDRDWTTKFIGGNKYNLLGPRLGKEEDFFSRHILDHPFHFQNYADKLKHGSEDEDSSSSPKATLCISVNSGSESDPEDFQGLAHLVEHMIFYGSKEYPGLDEFLALIMNKYKGIHGAYTAHGFTNYHCAFKSDPEAVEAVCERYGLMLSTPLFDACQIKKEIESVDNEYQSYRLNHFVQLINLINCHSIIGKHPIKQNNCGSRATLFPDYMDCEYALTRLKDACHRFIDTHYYGSNISVVLQANETLDFLESIAANFLGVFPTFSKHIEDIKMIERNRMIPHERSLFNRMYCIKPPKSNSHEFVMGWTFHPAVVKFTKALQYVAYLLCNTHSNGLFKHLSDRGLVIDISHFIENGSKFYTYLYVRFELTDAGRNCLEEVIKDTFAFIKLHQKIGPQEGIYKELQRLDQFRFDNCRLDTSLYALADVANCIHIYYPNNIIIGPTFLDNGCTTCNVGLQGLELENTVFVLMSWDFDWEKDGIKDSIDPIFGAHYIVEEMEDRIRRSLENVEAFPKKFAKIAKNPLTCFLRAPDEDPRMIEQNAFQPNVEMTYFPETSLASPQGVFLLEIYPNIRNDYLKASNYVVKTWVAMLNLEIQFGEAFNRELGSDVYAKASGGDIALVARGFQTNLAEAIIRLIDKFQGPLDPEKFEVAKHIIMNGYYGQAANSIRLATDYLAKLKSPDYVTLAECYEKLEKLEFEELEEFVDLYRKEIYISALSLGWINREEERKFADRIQTLRSNPFKWIISNYVEETKVPKGQHCLRVKSLLDQEKVCAVINSYEVEINTYEEYIFSYIIHGGLRRAVFNKLRTEEQLGYTVFAGRYEDFDNWKAGIYIGAVRHMDKHCPCYIDCRIDNLVDNYYKNGDLEKLAQGFVWLKYDDIKKYYEKNLLSSSGERSKLSIQVISSPENDDCLNPTLPTKLTTFCKRSNWNQPIHRIGFQKAEIALARDAVEDDTLSMLEQVAKGDEVYFISDIAKYHGKPSKSTTS